MQLHSRTSHIRSWQTCCKMWTYLSITLFLFPMVSVLTSLPTASITPLKQPYLISMIISSMPSDHRSCHVFVSLMPLPIPLIHNIPISHLLSWFGIHSSVLSLTDPVIFHVKSCVSTAAICISYQSIERSSTA